MNENVSVNRVQGKSVFARMPARRAMVRTVVLLVLACSSGVASVPFAAGHASPPSAPNRVGSVPARALMERSSATKAKPHRVGRATSTAAGAVPTFVSQKAQSVASATGDSTPTSVTAVLTTRAAATALQGAQSIDSASAQVWFVEMTGNFVDKNFFGFGTPPTGTEVDFTVDAQTQDVLDFGISNSPPDLASLGTVYTIASN